MNIKTLHKKLIYIFTADILVIILVAMAGYFIAKNNDFSSFSNTSTIKTFVILYVLISIPLALKFFSVNLQKISAIDNVDIQARNYLQTSIIRLFFITIGLIASMICFFCFKKMDDMLYLVAIEFVILVFCVPTRGRVLEEWNKIKKKE